MRRILCTLLLVLFVFVGHSQIGIFKQVIADTIKAKDYRFQQLPNFSVYNAFINITAGDQNLSTPPGTTAQRPTVPGGKYILRYNTDSAALEIGNPSQVWKTLAMSSTQTFDTTSISNFGLKVRSQFSATSPLQYNAVTGVFSIPQATSSVSGYLASADWVIFNAKLPDPGSNGLIARTALGTTFARQLVAASTNISIVNANGVSGNPSLDLNDTLLLTQIQLPYIPSAAPPADSVLVLNRSTSLLEVRPSYAASVNISNASLTANGSYSHNWSENPWFVDSIASSFLFRMGGVGNTGTRRKEFRINWGGSSFGDQFDSYNILASIKKADLSADSLTLGMISNSGVLSMGAYNVAASTNNTFISYSAPLGLINIQAKDSIWIKGATPAATADSILAVVYRSPTASRIVKIPLSAAGSSTILNNIGTGFAWAATPSGDIKRVANSNTILWDSTSTANSLTAKVDTSVIATQYGLGLKERIFNVIYYGADSTGVLDATAAIQAAINACFDAGGGTVYFPNGRYKISGALQTSVSGTNPNCQLYIPPCLSSSGHRPQIILRGESNQFVTTGYSSFVDFPLPTVGSRIISTISGSGYMPAVFGAIGPSANYQDYNFVDVRFENINIQTYTNGGAAPATMMGIRLNKTANTSGRNVTVSLDVKSTLSQNPIANEVVGIWAGSINGGAHAWENCLVQGYKYGYVFGEHARISNMWAWACNYAVVIPWGNYSVTGTITPHACNYAVLFPNSNTLGVAPGASWVDLIIENEEDTLPGPADGFWFNKIAGIVDTGNNARGVVRVMNGKANVAVTDASFFDFSVVGGGNLTVKTWQDDGIGTFRIQNVVDDNVIIGSNVRYNKAVVAYERIRAGKAESISMNDGNINFWTFDNQAAGYTSLTNYLEPLKVRDSTTILRKAGIGTQTPTELLHIYGNVGSGGVVREILENGSSSNGYAEMQLKSDISDFRFGTGGTGSTPFNFAAGSGYVGTVSNHSLVFATNSTVRASIANSGAITFGTSSSSYTFPTTRGSAGQVLTDVSGSGTVTWETPSGATTIYNGDGALGADRNFASAGFTLRLSGANNSDTVMSIINSGTSGIGLFASGSLFGADVQSTNVGLRTYGTVQGLLATGENSYGATIKSNSIAGLLVQSVPATTNTVQEVARFERGVNGSPGANGIGGSATFYNKRTDNASALSNSIESILTDAVAATLTSRLNITGINSGTPGTIATFDGNGNATFGATNSIVGTATNNNAVAGNIGEYVESNVASGSAVSLTTATSANVTSISLTAGDWDVDGLINYSMTGATTANFSSGSNSTSATLGAENTFVYTPFASAGLTDQLGNTIPTRRFSLSGTTTIYLVGNATFSVGSTSAYGLIRARRVR